MPTFAYETLDPSGRRVAGSLEAANESGAADLLRRGGARILTLRQSQADSTAGGTAPGRFALFRRVSTTDRIQAFGHLSMMIRAGLSLTQSLHLITPETQRPRLRAALEDVTFQVESGIPFSTALAAHENLFPPIVTTIIGSAEESGEMADGLDRVCHHLRFWSELRRKMIQSMTYPAIVVLAAVGVTVLLVTVFIPKVEKFVNKGGRSLPAITQFLFDVSHFFGRAWPWLIVAAILAGVSLFLAFRKPGFRLWAERILMKLPGLGGAWQAAMLARTCGLLGVLLQSGASLVRAIEVGADAVGSLHYRAVFLETMERVMRGLSLRKALAQPGIPGSFLGVVAAGEESGNLPQAFQQLETHYAERLSSRMMLLITLIEPALILGVGGIVAIVYLALFSAVLSLLR